MSFSLNVDSVTAICESDHAMVYGYSDCLYTRVHNALMDESEKTPVKKVFTGDPAHPDSYAHAKTLQKRSLMHIDLKKKSPSYVKRFCKNGLVSIVWENYLRVTEGLKPIPVIFCINKEGNKRSLSTSEEILSKSKKESTLITHSEIRRAYKLCFDEQLPQEIKDIALKTFKFVGLKRSSEANTWSLVQLDAPWENKEWNEHWSERKAQSSTTKKQGKWRKELNKLFTKATTKSFFKKMLSTFF